MASMIVRPLGHQPLEDLLALVGAVHRVEIGGELDVGIALERRVRGHALIDLERERRLLHLLVEVGERHQRERMARREIDRELQIGEREILAALAAERGAEPEQDLRGAGLRRFDQRGKLLVALELVHRVDDQRMLRQHLVERLVDLQRLVLAGIARGPAAIGLDRAQRIGVELVDLLQPLAGFLLVPRQVEDQPGMQVLEDRVPLRTGEAIDPLDRAALVLRAKLGPGRDQRRGQVRDRTAHRLRDVLARRLILLRLERAHAEHEPGDAMGLVELDDALGELDGVLHLAVDQDGEEGTLEQQRILRIGAQRRAVIGGGRHGVALDAGVARRQIVARRRIAREFLLGRSRPESSPARTAWPAMR